MSSPVHPHSATTASTTTTTTAATTVATTVATTADTTAATVADTAAVTPFLDRDQSFTDRHTTIARGECNNTRKKTEKKKKKAAPGMKKEIANPTKNMPGESGIFKPGASEIITVPAGLLASGHCAYCNTPRECESAHDYSSGNYKYDENRGIHFQRLAYYISQHNINRPTLCLVSHAYCRLIHLDSITTIFPPDTSTSI